jgi:hypothetical protein
VITKQGAGKKQINKNKSPSSGLRFVFNPLNFVSRTKNAIKNRKSLKRGLFHVAASGNFQRKPGGALGVGGRGRGATGDISKRLLFLAGEKFTRFLLLRLLTPLVTKCNKKIGRKSREKKKGRKAIGGRGGGGGGGEKKKNYFWF